MSDSHPVTSVVLHVTSLSLDTDLTDNGGKNSFNCKTLIVFQNVYVDVLDVVSSKSLACLSAFFKVSVRSCEILDSYETAMKMSYLNK